MPDGADQSQTQAIPIGVVRPTDSDDVPPRVPEVLIASDPVAFCLHEAAACFAHFSDSIELDDDSKISNDDVCEIVSSTYIDTHLCVHREWA